jgi:hypothetical protein
MKIDWMLVVLCSLAVLVGGSLWRAHRSASYTFDLLDLIMENGRVSKIAVAFMLVLGVSTWVVVDLQIKDKLTDGMFGLWLGAWVTPLVAKVVFSKVDPPSGTTITTSISQTEKTTP